MVSASFPFHHLLLTPNPSFLSSPRNLLPHRRLLYHPHPPATSASSAVDQPSTPAERSPRKKKNKSSTTSTPKSSSKRPGRPKKSPPLPLRGSGSGSGSDAESDTYSDLEFDDGIDFPYEEPPLVCCFGGPRREFLPTVRVHDNPMHPDIYSQWKMLQWDPPEFARAPVGPASNVAISHVRLGGRAVVLGKVGGDWYGDELVLRLNQERVQTRGIRFESEGDGQASRRTGCSYMRVKEMGDGRMGMEVVRDCPEDSLQDSELNLGVLKEARVFHFTSEVLTSADMQFTLFKAIRWSKKFGGLIFFDLNLPLHFLRSQDETKEVIKKAWRKADIIEVSRQELEFLLDEDFYERKRSYRPQYYAENYEQSRNRRNCYHYTREEISHLWHDKLKFLFVTDGTLRIHYYAPGFDGVVVGTEDVLITPFTCDRTGSGDAVVAAILRKLTTHPEMYSNQDYLERQLRFAIAAGIIAQWTIDAVRGFPTESATQNLKEQVYVPSMWWIRRNKTLGMLAIS